VNPIVTERFRNLAGTLVELKVKARTALATELAGAIATAIRDVLVVAIIDRIVTMPSRTSVRPGPGEWRADAPEDPWGEHKDSWSDDDEVRNHAMTRYDHYEIEPMPPISPAAIVAVGVNVGRWWIARNGTVGTAVGLGVLTTALGLAGGSVARAALAVLAAATDVLTAETALARTDHS